jgi:hypothetical protein
MVVSYCTPGSAQAHAASAICFQRSFAGLERVDDLLRSVRQRKCHVAVLIDRAHELVRTRTRVVAVLAADRVVGLAVEVARVARGDEGRAFFSSRTFHSMKSTISGWSMSRQTIFAARRVVPPLLVAPAARSSTSRKLIRPELVPAARELLLLAAEVG